MIQRLSTVIISLCLSFPSSAQVSSPQAGRFGKPGGSDFYVGLDRGKPLMSVSILNGVNTPGVYHLPIGSSISELLSYSGGATRNSDLSDIRVRSKVKAGEFRSVRIDLTGLMDSKTELPTLKDKDVVFITQNESLDNSIKWMSLASMAATIVSVIVVIDNN